MPHLLILLIQIIIIILLARLVGLLFRMVHQPQVVGEMIAGILLGPSLFGWLCPELSAALFPAASLGFLNLLSQLGLLLFMFLVGLELNPQIMRGREHVAVLISHVSIIVPFFLGTVLALQLYPRLSDDRVAFSHFALFMGAAMSVTAFPVLARILSERKLTRTHLGTVTIACAAVDDVTAWCILACVVVLTRTTQAAVPLWLTIAGSAAYVGVLVFGVRRLLGKLEVAYEQRQAVSQNMLTLILALILASAVVTEGLGIHALFGAFIMGAIMPKSQGFVQALTHKLEDIVVTLLLPLYFAFTGLRTSIGLVSSAEMWFYCGLIIVVAIAGKFGGSAIAARIGGLSWREASALGVLMNTRGLMELVILNVGLDIGVISPAVFTMMVTMALVTTFMTTPLLKWLYPTPVRVKQPANTDSELVLVRRAI